MTLRLRYAIRSDVGYVREGNEDSAYAGSHLLVVADGMGGHAAGEVASSTVIGRLAELEGAALITTGGGAGPDVIESLRQAMREANGRLRQMTRENEVLEGMGTTVTALLSSGSRLGLLHVGDSRAYRLRGGELRQVTHDHTLVQDLVDQGRITLEQANHHPQRSLLMRALDGREVEPDLELIDAQPGDRFLLCSDGLSSVVTVENIRPALETRTPQEAVDRLVELALAGGGPDNITVVVADVTEDGGPPERPLVAGAAAEKRVVPGADPARTGPHPSNGERDSPAAKGARLGRGEPGRPVDGYPAGDYPTGDYPTGDHPTAGGGASGQYPDDYQNSDMTYRDAPTMPTGRPHSQFQDGGQYQDAGQFPDAEHTQVGLATPKLTRDEDDQDDFDLSPAAGGPPPRRSRLPLIAGLVALVLIVLIAIFGWSYKNKQYYVGQADGHLAVYRGLSASIPLIHLHNNVQDEPSVTMDELRAAAPNNDQIKDILDQINGGGIAQSSKAEADAYVKNVRSMLDRANTPTTSNPGTTPSASPTPASPRASTAPPKGGTAQRGIPTIGAQCAAHPTPACVTGR